MTSLTRRGATVELAISAALQALNVSRDEVEIEVIEEGKKGFLGFGAKEAVVTVTVNEVNEPSVPDQPVIDESQPKQEEVEAAEPDSTQIMVEEPLEEEPIVDDQSAVETTEAYLRSVAKGMKIDDLQVNHETNGKYVTFQLDSKKAAVLIGKRGQTLNALQQLAQLVANKTSDQFKVVRIDIGNYRERREQSLQQLAERMADKAVRNGRKVQLEPMPSHERKVIHHALSNRLDIETYSEGADPHRYLIIEPIK
ncbi:RNA-binding protein [Bacillus sp. OxB-1]|uniref:RNA-binding cell elongation regulator Jag/EloR n=1 Tax=Bacillus sp. (strain OxB-1) TaxID=98228 RepID=UPI000581E7D9|nr:RNA-binding cell elongation regulator Jag/EloR [Bacillus sp. OxB-1]BAQ09439.1 RNA-binding protein [Bacillus sp. OxB-1]